MKDLRRTVRSTSLFVRASNIPTEDDDSKKLNQQFKHDSRRLENFLRN